MSGFHFEVNSEPKKFMHILKKSTIQVSAVLAKVRLSSNRIIFLKLMWENMRNKNLKKFRHSIKKWQRYSNFYIAINNKLFRSSDIAVIRMKFREKALDSGSIDLLLCQGIILK